MTWEIAFALFAIVQVVDVLSTVRALDRGGKEDTWLIQMLMEYTGKMGWPAIKLALACLAAFLIYLGGEPWWLVIVSAGYLPIIFNNMQVGR